MGFNWVDIVIVATIFLFAIDGFGRPFIFETLDFLSFLTAFFLSFIIYPIPAKLFESLNVPYSLSLIIGFIAVWILSEWIFSILVGKFVVKYLYKTRFFIVKTGMISVIPAVARALIFTALTLVVVATFPIRADIKNAVNDSLFGSQILKRAYGLERPVKNVFGGLSTDTLTFVTVKPATNENIDLDFKTADFHPIPDTEDEMINLVNKERISWGFKALEFDRALGDLGRLHSGDMLTQGYFSHFTPEGKDIAKRADKAGIDYTTIGENLAYAPSLELAHSGLMNSPGHRANILSPDFNKIGIGIMDAGTYGLMVTQVFSN
ncbi:MAG: CvpA family protein [Candidatus Daviesbacteria bacterium]|nr:CvpA family protein [Candidatus Daviesbacteria bacterium]